MKIFCRTMLKALLTALITATVLVFIFSFISLKSDDPARLISVFATASFVISCFMGGMMSCRGKGNILFGVAFAVIYPFICLTVSLILNRGMGISGIFTCLGGIAAAFLGGVLFLGSGSKKPKSLKRAFKRRSTSRYSR